jgi:hypothetical protein
MLFELKEGASPVFLPRDLVEPVLGLPPEIWPGDEFEGCQPGGERKQEPVHWCPNKNAKLFSFTAPRKTKPAKIC